MAMMKHELLRLRDAVKSGETIAEAAKRLDIPSTTAWIAINRHWPALITVRRRRISWLIKHLIGERVESTDRSLRSIAEEFGVSHDSVWRVALTRRTEGCDQDFRDCRPTKCPGCNQRITRIPCVACVIRGRLVEAAEAAKASGVNFQVFLSRIASGAVPSLHLRGNRYFVRKDLT